MAGAIVILAAVVTMLVAFNVRQETRNLTRLMLNEGDALLSAFEAASRAGIRGGLGNQARISMLLEETTKHSDIRFLVITDEQGKILLSSTEAKLGKPIFAAPSSRNWHPVPRPNGVFTRTPNRVRFFWSTVRSSRRYRPSAGLTTDQRGISFQSPPMTYNRKPVRISMTRPKGPRHEKSASGTQRLFSAPIPPGRAWTRAFGQQKAVHFSGHERGAL